MLSAMMVMALVGLPLLSVVVEAFDAPPAEDDTGTDADQDGGTGDTYVVTGDDNANELIGTIGADEMNAGGGDDTLTSFGGDDTLSGGAGDDRFSAGDGNDVVDGGEGNDNLNGNAGDDTMDGGAGDDRLDGGEGNNVLLGGTGADTLIGTIGADILDGNTGDGSSDDAGDVLTAGGGDDTLSVGLNDTVLGGDGADRFELLSDVTGSVSINDFTPTEDLLVVLHEAGAAPEVSSQEVLETALVVTLSSGAQISLLGLSSPLTDDQISFVERSA